MGLLKSILGALGITQGEPEIRTSVTDRAGEIESFHGYEPVNVNMQPKTSGDCMSLKQYAVKGKYKKTGRVRMAAKVFTNDEATAIEFLRSTIRPPLRRSFRLRPYQTARSGTLQASASSFLRSAA